MLRTGIRFVGLAVIATALTLATGTQATADPHHSGGGGHNWSGGGGHNWSGGGWSGHYGGWNGGWGGRYYGGYSHYYYPRSYGYGYNYWPYSYSYYPYYYTYPSYNSYYYSYPNMTREDTGAPGKVTVIVPDNAEVWFNNKVTRGPAPRRWFESPDLSSGQEYPVTIRASWSEGGVTVERSRAVDLHAGDNIKLDFMTRTNPPSSGSGTTEVLPQPGK